jgi:hypothetical protein
MMSCPDCRTAAIDDEQQPGSAYFAADDQKSNITM